MIKKYLNVKKLLLVFLGSALMAISIDYFIIPAGLYTAGFSGLTLVISTLTNGQIDFSIIYFILNIPLLIISWFKLGKRFTFYTILSVIFFTIVSLFLPDIDLISNDTLIMAIFGGIITGTGVLLTLKAGGSAGGLDILSILYSEKTGNPMGQFAMVFNFLILVVIAMLFDIEIALYTLISAYIANVVIDRMHTRYKKLALMINMSHPEEFVKEFQSKSLRGITKIPAIGAYTGNSRTLLYIIITSYELTVVLDLLKKHDPHAFVNVTKCEKVFGNFVSLDIDEI